MSSILDVSSMYDSYASFFSSTSASSLKDSLESVNSDSDDEELMNACKSFESYFVQKIIQQAEETVKSDDEEEGEYLKYFGDTLTQAYADAITDSGEIGLAQQLYDSMKQNYKI